MNIKLVGNLGLFGVLFGALSSFGYVNQFEWVGWLVFLVLAPVLIRSQQKEKLFLPGAVAGFLFAFAFYAMQLILMTTYTQTHPDFLRQVQELSRDLTPQSFMIFSGMIFAAIYGVVTGLFTIGLQKFSRHEKH
jgi:hypothetical protein